MSRYKVIISDPPWRQSKGGKKAVRPNSSGEALDYKVISLEEIAENQKKAMQLADADHSLFLWAIDKYLHEAEQIAKELGYKLHARMIWNKVTGIPAAFTIRYGHEYLLWFYKDKLPKIAAEERGKIHSVFTEKVKKHSQKPEISYEIIERLYPYCKKLEMYARGKARCNYDVFGDQAEESISL